VHSLSTSFVLGYHGCTRSVGELLLKNERFEPSTNPYDWLGTGVYFWEANPDRALAWAEQVRFRNIDTTQSEEAFVVGAVIDPGFCLDLISSNGIAAVKGIYPEFCAVLANSHCRCLAIMEATTS
jgi:hypothetical protein